MCGIAGEAWTCSDGAVDQLALDRMTDVLRHRGQMIAVLTGNSFRTDRA